VPPAVGTRSRDAGKSEQYGLVEIYQVAVVGGGPAGLQAALTLGRMHVSTVVFDDARYRNTSSARMHNVLGRDGATPDELRSVGRAELQAYPWVDVVESRVDEAERQGSTFVLRSRKQDRLTERVLIASGVQDTLLPIPGLAELWGDVVLPCPYCHGHEFSHGPIAVISSGGHADHVGGLLRGLTASVPVLSPESVRGVVRSESGVTIQVYEGTDVEAACVFIPANAVPRSSLAEQLGATTGEDGIIVDPLGRTDSPGVWAAGDVARRLDARIPAAVVTAMASGLTAGADIAAAVALARDDLD
jgi:thioredoxin reductase